MVFKKNVFLHFLKLTVNLKTKQKSKVKEKKTNFSQIKTCLHIPQGQKNLAKQKEKEM